MHAGARCWRRRPAFRPQAGEILAGQVIQDSLDHCMVFATCNHLYSADAIRADINNYFENPLEV